MGLSTVAAEVFVLIDAPICRDAAHRFIDLSKAGSEITHPATMPLIALALFLGGEFLSASMVVESTTFLDPHRRGGFLSASDAANLGSGGRGWPGRLAFTDSRLQQAWPPSVPSLSEGHGRVGRRFGLVSP